MTQSKETIILIVSCDVFIFPDIESFIVANWNIHWNIQLKHSKMVYCGTFIISSCFLVYFNCSLCFDCCDATKVLIKTECKTCKNKHIFDFLNKLITKVTQFVGAKHINAPKNNGKTIKKIQIKQYSLFFFPFSSSCLIFCLYFCHY